MKLENLFERSPSLLLLFVGPVYLWEAAKTINQSLASVSSLLLLVLPSPESRRMQVFTPHPESKLHTYSIKLEKWPEKSIETDLNTLEEKDPLQQ